MSTRHSPSVAPRVRLAALALLPLGVASLTAVSLTAPAAEAAVRTCDGKPATIVFDGNNQKVNGTPGDDVMYVTGDSNNVDGKAGADTICYIGGSYSDDRSIRTGDADDERAGDPPSHDVVINTADRGDPRDTVDLIGGVRTWVISGTKDVENDDDITTFGELTLAGYPTGDLVGTGPKSQIFFQTGTTFNAYDIDLRENVLKVGDHDPASLDGFTDYILYPQYWTSIRFRGTEAPEILEINDGLPNARKPKNQSIDLRMGGGRDTVYTQTALPGLVSGGRGIDTWEILFSAKKIDLSVPQGTLTPRPGAPVPIAGLEHFKFSANKVDVIGSNAPERFEVAMQRGKVDARGGNDRLFVTGADKVLGGDGNDAIFNRFNAGAGRTDDDMRGGKGNDRLHGGPGSDVLLGGPGKDYAVGGGNKGAADSYNDTCRAEKTLNCDVVL